MKQILLCVSALAFLLTGFVSFAQSNPTAQSLPYTQDFAAYTGATTTYLAGWQGWDIAGSTATTYPTAAPSANRAQTAGANNLTTATVTDMNGKLGLMSTGSALRSVCLSISTNSLTAINVSYLGATQYQSITGTPRIGEIGVQYRVGTSGTFTNVASSTYQNNNAAANTTAATTNSLNPQTISFTLPVACEGQAVVQLRWVYREVSGSGNRPGYSIDNISISGTAPATPTLSANALTAFGGICTGANATNSFTITGSNLTTAGVEVDALAGYTFSTDNTTFTDSLDLVSAGGAFSQLVYVRFSPTLVQSYNGNIPVNGGGAPAITVSASGSGIVNAIPTITTNTSASVTATTAVLGANITSLNCSTVTSRGIEWSTTPGFANGTGTAVNESGSFSTGTFTMSVTGLPSSSIIYYHAYATNGNGIAYSTESSFVTNMNITDLTILAMNSSTPDNFAFVAWVDMPVGTKIKFTDNGFLSSGSANAAGNGRGVENFVSWTNSSASAIAAGTVVTITDGVGASVGTISQTLNGLTGSGEQIFAYQGTGAGTSVSTSDFGTNSNPSTFTGSILYGINLQGSGASGSATWLTTGTASANASYLPSELNVSNANNSFGSAAVAAHYTGPRTGQATFAGYKALLHNPANWTTVTTGSVTVSTTSFILSAGGPSQIAVTSVNGGVSPTSGSSFTLSIEAQDGTNVGAAVSQDTDVLVSIFTGTGALIGTTTGTILDGQSTLTLTGLVYNIAETGVILSVSRTSGDVLSTGNSSAFNVLQGATQIAFTNVSSWSFTNSVVPFFNVEARRPDNTVDNTFTGNVTISLTSGTGLVLGTLTKACVAGVATFNDISFDTPGSKQLSATCGAFAVITSAAFTISTPSLTENILPQFIEGINTTNNNRIPFACFLTLNGLQPNSTYFYSNQVVLASDLATTNGAGNPIYVSGGGFTRSSSPNFTTAGAYGSFTTNSSGSYSGWYVTEPTANATRFIPGNDLYMRIALNNGAGGTFTALRMTTTSSFRVLSLGTGASNGTGLRGNSSATATNFVVAYDNVAGTGRPISATYVESDGLSNTTGDSYAAFYGTSVNGVAGAYGMVVPNTLPFGIRRLEQRFRTTGAIMSCPATDADGVWTGGANTVNPAGGTTALVITATDAPFDPLCVPVISGNNDNFVNATVCQPNGISFPASRCFTGDLVGANISPEGNTANVLPGAGQDRWYRIASGSAAMRITATSATSDLIIEVRTYEGTEIDVENAVVGSGQEILVMNGLTTGATYFVGVRSYDGTVGPYTLCVSQLNAGNVNTNTSLPLDVCSTFKPTSTGATNYTVSFVPVNPSVGGGSITTTTSFSLSLASLNLYPGNTYTVTVTSNYVGLVDGAGNVLPTISLVDATPATLIMAAQGNIQVRSTQRCDAPATLLKSTVVRSEPFVCGVTNYTIRFTPASDCAGTVNGVPFVRTQVSRFISLNFDGTDTAPLNQTIQAQTYYIIEIRPNFGPAGVYPGTFGTGRVIFVGGAVLEDAGFVSDAGSMDAAKAMLFPNPGNGQHVMLDYSIDGEQQVELVLRDAMGRLVANERQMWTGNGVSEMVFQNSLAKGIYMLEIRSESQRETLRWIVE